MLLSASILFPASEPVDPDVAPVLLDLEASTLIVTCIT